MKIFYYVSIFLLFSCTKEKVHIEPYNETTSDSWGFKKPSNFPDPDYKFENNEQTRLRFELGRYLFYDSTLSVNNTISCASCHAQSHGFADHNVTLSTGVFGLKTTRNAPALINLAWNSNFMWDGGVNHIEVQPLVPLTNPHEMGETIENILAKLNASTFYKSKFKEAYNVDVITDQKMLQALAQFTAMLISSNTKYDQYINGKIDFTTEEKRGLDLFRENCTNCHTEPLFTDFSYRNVGIDSTITDVGRFLITQLEEDKGKFKVPTLRNVAETYPYMHDGRYYTLSQLLNHHTNGAIDNGYTDSYILTVPNFSSSQKLDLIAFLNTLTDYYLIGDPSLSEPKK